MASKISKSGSVNGVQKHRACDECRSRKLACSKELDGCSRCLKEGIKCHYSPHKPMGRPRKRRNVEDGGLSRSSSTGSDVPITRPDVAPVAGAFMATEPMIPLDPSLDSFLNDAGVTGMEFMDLLPYPDVTVQPDAHMYMATAPEVNSIPLSMTGVDFFGDINFGEPHHTQEPFPRDAAASFHRYMDSQYPALDLCSSPPSDLLQSTGTPEPFMETRTLKPNPTTSCGCLSSLYLTLDCLARLPTEVYAAMRVARNASKVAYDVIHCPHCSHLAVPNPLDPVPMQSFQNLMCLAALVPAACNAYAAILEMVDTEASRARKSDRTLWFSFKEIGGLWGRVGDGSSGQCRLMQSYNNKHMAPEFWRTTVRAVLRLDIYGFTEVKTNQPAEAYSQQGLKDIIELLDERSRKRHDELDALIASGKMPKESPYLLQQNYKSPPPQERMCIKMFDTARIALNNLIIA